MQRHTDQVVPDLTARSFEADKITLKCKGDMTVSSEPDGSILSLAHQDLSSGSAAMFVRRRLDNRLSLSATMSAMLSISRFPFLCCN